MNLMRGINLKVIAEQMVFFSKIRLVLQEVISFSLQAEVKGVCTEGE